MTLLLIALALLNAVELATYTPLGWRLHFILIPLVLLGVALTSGAWFVIHTNGWSYLALLTALYRCFNLLRVLSGISSEPYRRHAGLHSSWYLILLQALSLACWYGSERLHNTGYQGWLAVAVVQLLVAVILWRTTTRSIRHTVPALAEQQYADHDLPSISVLVPARDETESLHQSLQALLASNYPKLEIIVLDDCSHDRTPEVIKAFAHDGVRFISGRPTPEDWLAKNWAYQQLYEQANGQLLVFCGVDVQLSPTTLRSLVATMMSKRKRMVCVVPQNSSPAAPDRWSLLLQPMRYAWELSLPRRLFNRPPVLSSCWTVEHLLAKQIGGFAAVRRSISPESHFARAAITEDGYSFIRSTADLPVSATKPLRDQFDTAIRSRYPQLHKRPELVLLLGVLEALLVIAPLPLAIASLLTAHWLLALISLTAFGIDTVTYRAVVKITYGQPTAAFWLSLLPACLFDIYLRNYSMLRYEFTEVIWKGRNICLPVMQVIPRLPKL